ncbi:unnamed protein product [Paramecium pentaurelia]|uniref:Transmembrane protein n=1 Tax=Paramecium pentaurelia TaxID=43138 RepID=A0A8S1VSR7_9CILI|nr:unnamed protein product [Paramecium pentaurelia]
MNIILDRQASLCYFPNSSDVDHIDKAHQFDQKDFTKDLCNLTNFGYFIPKTDYTSTLVTEYFVQLKSYNYADQNFTECLKSTSYNLTLTSICQNDAAQYTLILYFFQYWLSIYFDSYGSTIIRSLLQIPQKFTNIKKISNTATLKFILGSKDTYDQGLYLLNPLNKTMQLHNDNLNFQDFSVALFNSSLDMNQQNLVLILYFYEFDVLYNYLTFNKSLGNTQQLSWDHQICAQILILKIIDKQIYILSLVLKVQDHYQCIGFLKTTYYYQIQKPLSKFMQVMILCKFQVLYILMAFYFNNLNTKIPILQVFTTLLIYLLTIWKSLF